MRRSFDGLIALADEYIRQDPRSGACFVFFGKNRKMLKVLRWEGDGFSLWSKRLEYGCFQIPRTLSGHIELNYGELSKYLSGMSCDVKHIKIGRNEQK
jgi:transposase